MRHPLRAPSLHRRSLVLCLLLVSASLSGAGLRPPAPSPPRSPASAPAFFPRGWRVARGSARSLELGRSAPLLSPLGGPDLTLADARFYADSVPGGGQPIPAAASPSAAAEQRFRQVHPAMGTEFTLDLFAPDEARAEALFSAAFDEIDRLEALLSNYQPSSELSRLSREASIAPTVTDPETFRFLERSQFWSRRSAGAFDITVGPLLRTWGFFAHGGAVPSPAQLRAARRRVGWQKLHLDPATRTVSLSTPLELDPGSIGKGFAVDRVVALLRSEGVARAFLSAGNSTLFGLGAPPDLPGWPVEVPDPTTPTHATTVYLHNTSLSTGACTAKFFIAHGHRFCHIFDPRTGRPVEGVLQATVIDPSATDSDALSTVLFVLSPQQSQALLRSFADVQALVFRSPSHPPACSAIHWSYATCPPPGSSPHESSPTP